MIDLYKYKEELEKNKPFRDSERARLIQLRAKAHNDVNTQNVCNLVLTYIYDLDFKAVFNKNNKNI